MQQFDFNFAQPYWLLGLLLIPLGWIWLRYINQRIGKAEYGLEKFIDAKLLPHVLLNIVNKARSRAFTWCYIGLVSCVFLALANPRWDYVEIEAYKASASMVILLDLGKTMNAQDVQPSRIGRARQSIEDLLNLSKGLKVGLVGYAAMPHLISPITDDLQTVKTYLPAVDTDLTTLPGESLTEAFYMAQQLLENDQSTRKSILLVSDGNLVVDDYSKVIGNLVDKDITVNVLAVGTSQGVPYKDKYGALAKENGRTVITKLNQTLLQQVARTGHGLYVVSSHNDYGLQQILNKVEYNSGEETASGKVRQWHDRYYIFLVPAAIIMAYMLQRRLVFMLAFCMIYSMTYSSPVSAWSVKDAFMNSEQKAKQEFTRGEFVQAAQDFRDLYNKGVALYRAGQYAEAEQAFAQNQRAELAVNAQYNCGNSQMQQQKWAEAIKSYEDVLGMQPEHADAQHNLEIAKKMLAQQQKENDCNKCKDKQQGQNNQSKDGNKQQQQEQQDKSQAEQQKQHQDQQQEQQQEQEQQQQNSAAETEKKNQEQRELAANQQDTIPDSMTEQWLGRIDSDIKVFLRNKFYVEDVLSGR